MGRSTKSFALILQAKSMHALRNLFDLVAEYRRMGIQPALSLKIGSDIFQGQRRNLLQTEWQRKGLLSFAYFRSIRAKNSLRKLESFKKAPRITLLIILESASLTPRHCMQK